jgi:hypothetical protein
MTYESKDVIPKINIKNVGKYLLRNKTGLGAVFC